MDTAKPIGSGCIFNKLRNKIMKIVLAVVGIIVAAVAVFFIVPMAAGGSTNVCQALERHDVSKAATDVAGTSKGPLHDLINSVGQSMATGDIATQTEAAAHPNRPASISCAASYWQSL